ncbi:MAG: cyclic nucleotide-binding domain-containing protein [Rhizobiales bacterium]|nr:cyclic nucleotide-binding domain-containing protein [Hyphomicrobiales bacterium]
MKGGSCAQRQLRRLVDKVELFRGIGEHTVAEISRRARAVSFAGGEEIVRLGEPATSLYLLALGRAEVSVLGLDGRKVVVNVIGAPDLFGEIAIADGGPRTATVTALEAIDCWMIGRDDLLAALASDACLSRRLLELLARRLRAINEQYFEATTLSVPVRAARQLLRLEGRAGVSGQPVRISQEALAHQVAASREHMNRVLTGWRRGGIVEVVRGAIIIRDGSRLSKLAGFDHDRPAGTARALG